MPHDDLARAAWRKSSHSYQEGACVEIAPLADGVAVRDSKNPHGPALRFSPAAFRELTARVRTGHLDR